MAVVEKKPEIPTANTPRRLGVASLIGVVFVVGSFIAAFTVLPTVFKTIGLTGDSFAIAIADVLLRIATLVVLITVGFRLASGSQKRPGLRAGIFVGVVFVLLWALLSRWIGGILEGSTYNGWLQKVGPSIGTALFAGISAALAFWLLRIFLRPSFEQRLINFEEAGWFSATTYKPGQGTRVRRGTILGLLLLMGSGIWVMLNRGVLERGDSAWRINVPFTGKYAVEDVGDAAKELKNQSSDGIRILAVGSAKGKLDENATLDRETVLVVVKPLAEDKRKELKIVIEKLKDRQSALTKQLPGLRDQARTDAQEERGILDRWILRLEEFEKDLTATDESLLFLQKKFDRFVTAEGDTERERRKADKSADQRRSLREEMGWIVSWAQKEPLPVGAEVYTRYVVRDVNDTLDPDYYRVVNRSVLFEDLPKQYRFEKGQIVHRDDFERAVEELKKKESTSDDKKRVDEQARKDVPEAKPMKGNVYYSSITLLPGIRYTVPLLMLVLVIWLAWRIVNLPSFADFLIATEAEMNKVSWTTRHRLFQDTIVVLVTMVLMAMFLFLVDIAWARLLSSKPIGVLKVSNKQDKLKKESDLKW